MKTEMVIIVPTRGRPDSVLRVAEAWDATNAFADRAGLLFVVDSDDPKCSGYTAAMYKLAAENPNRAINYMYIPTWKPMVHKLDFAARAVWGNGFVAMGFAGDDHLPRTVGWAAKYLETLRAMKTGIVYGDDGMWHGGLCTEWAMTSDIVELLGGMVPAPVEHMYSDNSVLTLGRRAGCLRYLPDVLIEHMHPVVGKGELDDTYRRTNHTNQYARDEQAFIGWLCGKEKTDVQRLLRLIGGAKPDGQ